MKCPACQSATLEPERLDDDLPAMRCPSCQGRWISSTRYVAWIERLRAAGKAASPVAEPAGARIADTTAALLCPECGHILIKFHVGGEHDFALDRCNHCNGVWLDRGEWEDLRGRGLHERIAQVCSPAWQHTLAHEALRRAGAARCEAALGPADFARIRETRAWLLAHPRRTLLMAYLLDEEALRKAGSR